MEFGSDPKHETGMVEMEMEIDAAQVLADMAVKGPDPLEEVRDEKGEAKAVEGVNREAQEKTECNINELAASTSQSQTPIGRSRRGRQNLTEAEREAKRLRHILANRESARQTILRRQALHAELGRKVAALSAENQQIKMEKEMAMQEYLSLKEANRQLKEQLAHLSMSKPEVGANQIEPKPSSSTKFAGTQYSVPPIAPDVWGPWTPTVQTYIKCSPSPRDRDRGSAPSYGFSSNSSLNPLSRDMPPSADIKSNEEMQLLPSVDETEISCSLTLGLETENKPKTPAIKMCDKKVAPSVACPKEPDVPEQPNRVKAAAEARRRRREITRLKQMHRRA